MGGERWPLGSSWGWGALYFMRRGSGGIGGGAQVVTWRGASGRNLGLGRGRSTAHAAPPTALRASVAARVAIRCIFCICQVRNLRPISALNPTNGTARLECVRRQAPTAAFLYASSSALASVFLL